MNKSVILLSGLFTMLMFLCNVNYTNAQIGKLGKKDKTETTEENAEKKDKIGLSKPKIPPKRKVGKMFAQLDSLYKITKTKEAKLTKKYGPLMSTYKKKKQEIEEEMEVLGKKAKESDTYKAKSEELEALLKENEEFDREKTEWEKDLKKLESKGAQIFKKLSSDLKVDYYKKYEKYAEKRPETQEIILDPLFWELALGPDNYKTLQTLVSLNYLLYKLSTVYTDAFFNNTQGNIFLDKKQIEWEDEYQKLLDKNASSQEISQAQYVFIQKAIKGDEYKKIVKAKTQARQEYRQTLKEMAIEVLSKALKELLDTKKLQEVSRPDTVKAKDFLVMINIESKKSIQIINMTLKTMKGTSIVTGQAAKSVIVNQFVVKKGKKEIQNHICQYGNIEMIVTDDGKNQRIIVSDKTVENKSASYAKIIAESESSLAYRESQRNIRMQLKNRMNKDDIGSPDGSSENKITEKKEGKQLSSSKISVNPTEPQKAPDKKYVTHENVKTERNNNSPPDNAERVRTSNKDIDNKTPARSNQLRTTTAPKIIYRVQFLLTIKPLNTNDPKYADMIDIVSEKTGDSVFKHMTGTYFNFHDANKLKNKIRAKGYKDAFVVAYKNGVRIMVKEAQILQER